MVALDYPLIKLYTWTVDVELEWGGRTNGTDGIDVGLPLILKTFRRYNVKALFFISTEALALRPGFVSDIIKEGHEIGAHGHFHTCFNEPWRAVQNMEIAKTIIENYSDQERFEYRFSKFSYSMRGHIYSEVKNHISLLKHTWFGVKLPWNPIFYLHPFDIVEGKNPPNLFCRILYSRPKEVYENFTRLVRLHPGNIRLYQDQTET